MKILRIIARLNTGGPAIHTILLTRGLSHGRFSSRLVTGHVAPEEGDMSYYAEARGVVPTVIDELGNRVGLRRNVQAIAHILALIRSDRPDIVHTHTAKAGGIGRVAAILHNAGAALTGRRRVRIVHTFHGHIFHGYFSSWKSRALVVVERMLARFTDRVLVVSDAIKADLADRYRLCDPAKIAVVPLGLEFDWVSRLDAHAGWLRPTLAASPGTMIVGSIGRLTKVKNQELLFAALGLIGAPSVRVVVFGNGERRQELEACAAAAGVTERVSWVGWERDPARIYADLDLVCLTSRNEGTPVALIEAMAAGLAFVSTDVGGVRDLMVGEAVAHPEGFDLYSNGVLVPPDAPAVLAAALRYLGERPELRAAMGAVGEAAVLKRFSLERLLLDMESIYDALLARG